MAKNQADRPRILPAFRSLSVLCSFYFCLYSPVRETGVSLDRGDHWHCELRRLLLSLAHYGLPQICRGVTEQRVFLGFFHVSAPPRPRGDPASRSTHARLEGSIILCGCAFDYPCL